jgi:PHD/YefM family antitoxin component YafN of YafNO toxin-antitoxin module
MARQTETADASDVQRRFSYWKRRAQHAPVIVRHHGQDEVVLLSAEEFARLKRRDREVLRPEDFSDDELAAIAAAKVPDSYAHLNAELDDSSK